MPYFSIIIPTYNRAAILPRAMESVINQTFDDWELIIVDDGSSDDTMQVVESIHDDRISYVFQENKGVCAARNRGAKAAKGLYLVFLDSDDFVNSKWLLDFREFISEIYLKSPKVIISGFEIIRNGDSEPEILYPDSENVLNRCLSGTYAMSKELFHGIGGFDERLHFSENTEMFIRVLKSNSEIHFLYQKNFIYYDSDDGGSKNLKNKIKSIELILNKHRDFLGIQKEITYNQIIGVSYLRLHMFAKSRKYFWNAFKLKPWDVFPLIRIFISLVPTLSKSIYG